MSHGLRSSRLSPHLVKYVSLVYLTQSTWRWILQYLGSVRTNATAHSHLTLSSTTSNRHHCVSHLSSPAYIEIWRHHRQNARDWQVFFDHPVVCGLLYSWLSAWSSRVPCSTRLWRQVQVRYAMRWSLFQSPTSCEQSNWRRAGANLIVDQCQLVSHWYHALDRMTTSATWNLFSWRRDCCHGEYYSNWPMIVYVDCR